MDILVNNKIKELTLVDAKSGADWVRDMLGDHNSCGYDDDREIATMSEDDYNWWAAFLPRYEAADSAVVEYARMLDDSDSFNEALSAATSCDLEDMPAAMMEAIDEHRESILHLRCSYD